MMNDLDSATTVAVQVTRAAPLFDRLANTLLTQLVDAVRASEASAPSAAELAEVRERLDAFFPEFRRLYGGLLLKHIGGGERLAEVLAALSDESVQAYFRAVQAMEAELVGGLQSLTNRMAVVASRAARA